MLASLLLSATCLAFTEDVPAAKAGPSVARPHQSESEALVRKALASESEGREADRLAHLAKAVALDPANQLARSLMGLVAFHGRWLRPEAIAGATTEDPNREALTRDYLTKRAATPMKADAQVRLADWCAKNGLKEQARAHYRAAVQVDPSKESAWRHLGYQKQGNRWVRPEEAAAEKAESEAQKKADKQWRPRLEKIRDGLVSKDASRREKAEKELMAIRDPRAVPMILALLAGGGERLQLAAVPVLGQIEGPQSSNALAILAILSPFESVRGRASSALLYRDPGQVIGTLIGLIRRPFKYKVIPGDGPGTVGQVLVDGEAFDLRKIYRYPDMPQPVAFGVNFPDLDPRLDGAMKAKKDPSTGVMDFWLNRLRSVNMIQQLFEPINAAEKELARQETIRRSMAVEQRMEYDVQQLEATNTLIGEVNGRVLPILRTLTGQDRDANPESWRSWWANELGYVSASSTPAEKPTYVDSEVMPGVNYGMIVVNFHHGCFAAGTPVRTADGLRAIETLRVGDLVLSQNVKDGTLSYRPVTGTHVNGPADTLRLAISGETVVATGIHRFWKVGEGWVMARDLKPGMRVRMVGTTGVVESVRPDARQKIYNLDVEGNRDYFVGNRGFLVNDFGVVEPTGTPFDRLPATAALAGNP